MVLVASYLIGGIPFSGALAWLLKGVDLRSTGPGTVSGTGLYRVAGWRPLVAGGVLDLAKGAVGPMLAGPDRPVLQALAAGAAVAGHNWSPYLKGAGGRGISPALGAMLPIAPEGSVLLLAGITAGKVANSTSVGALIADVALVPVLARTRGRRGAVAAVAVVTPMLLKRLLGNRPPAKRSRRVLLSRLLFDQDEPPSPMGPGRRSEQP